MHNEIRIGKFVVGPGGRPFIIAEMSGNHNQSLERAFEIVRAAARSGVQAIKLQTYTADTLTLDVESKDFFISDEASLWKGRTLHSLYVESYTPWEWHVPLVKLARELGIECFSTPFDESAVEFLEKLEVPAYKIASFENVHLPLIKKVAATGKPLIISTGMATLAELQEAVDTARSAGCKNLILLKCTSTYPAEAKDSNLLTIPHLRDLFQCQVGLSDHTLGIGAAVASVALGATVVEKHLTLKRADGGVDSAFSLEPDEMNWLVSETKIAWEALGHISYGTTAKEEKSRVFRRSLYLTKDMKAGEVFSKNNVGVYRPGFGLAPKYLEVLIGKKINRDAKRGTPVAWDLVG